MPAQSQSRRAGLPLRLPSQRLAYIAAGLETDRHKAQHRFHEAVAAIEQQQLSPVEPDSLEEQALKRAKGYWRTEIPSRRFIPPILGTIVFFYGGIVFIRVPGEN
jgi:hypothetical protein